MVYDLDDLPPFWETPFGKIVHDGVVNCLSLWWVYFYDHDDDDEDEDDDDDDEDDDDDDDDDHHDDDDGDGDIGFEY